MIDLKQHLIRQMVFSRATFGPGERTAGVLDHIAEEMEEVREVAAIQAGPNRDNFLIADESAKEWADMVILSLDGLTRAIWAGRNYAITADLAAELAVDAIVSKQGKNELRDWPDWRTAAKGKAIKHVRGKHD